MAHDVVEVEVAHHVEVEGERYAGGQRVGCNAVGEVVVVIEDGEGLGVDRSGGAEDGGGVEGVYGGVGIVFLAIVPAEGSEDLGGGEKLKVDFEAQFAGETHERGRLAFRVR